MKKFFCDRCGKEIGSEKNIFVMSAVWSLFDIGDTGYSKDLCKECAVTVEKVLLARKEGNIC